MSYQERGHGRRSRSDKKHNGHHGKPKHVVGEKGREILESIDVNSPVIKCFQQYAAELDYKHDKYERIVKLSRDITIESKRIIFLLHTLDRESKRDSVLREAAARLSQLVNTHFRNIARELKGEDPFHYLRAYSSGVQEYVEAVTFHQYLTNNTLQNWNKIQNDFTYKEPKKEDERNSSTPMEGVEQEFNTPEPSSGGNNDSVQEDTIETYVSQMDYILGVADLTGELMRKCINNLGSGNIEGCYQTCTFVRDIHSGFLRVSSMGYKEMSRKMFVLNQSLGKMENVCYTIHVRGSEIPKHMLADVISGSQDEFMDEDEGFY